MTSIHNAIPDCGDADRSEPGGRFMPWFVLAIILLFAIYTRLAGLGGPSLWLDELSTWTVSRMNLGESLAWAPELTVPPLYQLILRAAVAGPHPDEWALRMPAMVCGVLAVAAGWWLGKIEGDWRLACSVAGLLAINAFQIRYSQEARPYTMLALASAVSLALWYLLVSRPTTATAIAFVLATATAFHAHYLVALTMLAEGVWWLAAGGSTPGERRSLRPAVALAATGVLCTPIMLRYTVNRSIEAQAIGWIEPPTMEAVLDTLGAITFGAPWLFGLLLPATVGWVAAALASLRGEYGWARRLYRGRRDLCGLLICALGFGWFGLVVLSWCVRSVFVDRYAISAAIPGLLIPLMIAWRIRGWLPVLIAAAFITVGIRESLPHTRLASPGFREMIAYINEQSDADAAAAVMLPIEEGLHADFITMYRTGFEYYPLLRLPLRELRLTREGRASNPDALGRSERVYFVLFRSDPTPALNDAAMRWIPITLDGQRFSQLSFGPHRLRMAAPAQ